MATSAPMGAAIWKKGTADVYVCPYWFSQFGGNADRDRHCALVVPKAVYDSWTADGKDKVRDGVNKLLSREVRATRANVASWCDQLAGYGVSAQVVLPNDTPTLGAYLYIVVCGENEKVYDRLKELGLDPNEGIPTE